MASISNDPNGRRRVLFVAADGSRKTIRCGKVSQRQAESVKIKIEDLVSASITGHAPSDETARWLAALDEKLYDKLSRAGLTKPRESAMLGPFTRAYVDSRVDVKETTRIKLDRSRSYLLEHLVPPPNLWKRFDGWYDLSASGSGAGMGGPFRTVILGVGPSWVRPTPRMTELQGPSSSVLWAL